MDEYDRAKLELYDAQARGIQVDIRYWTGYVDALRYMLKKHGCGTWDFELAEERFQRALAKRG